MDFRSPDNPYPFSREIERRDTGPLSGAEQNAARTQMGGIAALAVTARELADEPTFTRGDLCKTLDQIEERARRLRSFMISEKAARELSEVRDG